MVSFIFFTMSMMFFVISLQEGFYAYQFKRLGWNLLSTFCIVMGSTGLIVALWSNRLWFFFAVTSIVLHNVVDYIFSRFFPLKTPILLLKPKATLEGFLAGSFACFAYLYMTYAHILETDWIRQTPVSISLEPFNRSESVIASGPLWENNMRQINYIDFSGKVGTFETSTSPVEVHLFIMTLFIAFIAPFGGFFVAGLKRALRTEQLGVTLHKGGVIDRVDCILVTGLFLMIYVNVLVNSQSGEKKDQIKEMIMDLSDDAQKDLYWRLKGDITGLK